MTTKKEIPKRVRDDGVELVMTVWNDRTYRSDPDIVIQFKVILPEVDVMEISMLPVP